MLIECVIHLWLQTAEIKLSGTTPASQRDRLQPRLGEKRSTVRGAADAGDGGIEKVKPKRNYSHILTLINLV